MGLSGNVKRSKITFVNDQPVVIDKRFPQHSQCIRTHQMSSDFRFVRPADGIMIVRGCVMHASDQGLDTNPLDLRPGPYLQITVSNTGMELMPNLNKSTADPFFANQRIDQGREIVFETKAGAVHQHPGKLTLQCYKDGGSILKIYLPLVDLVRIH